MIILILCIIAYTVVHKTILYDCRYVSVSPRHEDVRSTTEDELKEFLEYQQNGSMLYDPATVARNIKALEYILDNDIDWSDWRYYAIDKYSSYNDPERLSVLWDIITTGTNADFLNFLDEEICMDMQEYEPYTGTDKMLELKRTIYALRIKYDIPIIYNEGASNDWRHIAIDRYYEDEKSILRGEDYDGSLYSDRQLTGLSNDADEMLFRIENDLSMPLVGDASDYLELSVHLMTIVGFMVIIAAVSCFGVERKNKTTELLFMSPHSRVKIWLSKFIAVILYSLILTVFLFVFVLIVGATLYGGDFVYGVSGYDFSLFSMNIVPYVFVNFMLRLVEIWIYTLIAILMISAFDHPESASVFTVILYIMGAYGFMFLAIRFKLHFFKYVPFAWFDMSQFWTGTPKYDYVDFTRSLTGLIISAGLLTFACIRTFTANKDN